MIKEVDLVNNMNNYLSINNNIFANEIRMGNGIPDIMVGLSLNQEAFYLNDYYQLKILDRILQDNIYSVSTLLEVINLPGSKVKKVLKELAILNVVELDNDKIGISRKVSLIDQCINVSIEVKIKDWRNGLLQAERYLKFSDYSYLAIKSEYIKNVDFNLAQNLGIGIISLADDNIQELVEPKKSTLCNSYFKHISLAHLSQHAIDRSSNETFLSIQG